MALPKRSSQNPSEGGKSRRNSINWIWLILLFLVGMQILFSITASSGKKMSYSQLPALLRSGDVEEVLVVNEKSAEIFLRKEVLGDGDYEDIPSSARGPHFSVKVGALEEIQSLLATANESLPEEKKFEYDFPQRTDLGSVFMWLLPFLLIIGIWLLIMRRMRPQGGMGGANIFDFGKSKATLFKKDETEITFNDVAGLDEVKVEVREVVDFLKNPLKYTRLGAKIPKGVLLIGPPGTGKTLLAKAVAGEAGVPFYSISGSEFVEMFVGVGASRVRDLFRKAKQNAPSIIFIDEIDAIGRSRGKAVSVQSNDERENTLNQMLTEMDGFGNNTGVIVIAATNRGEILDRALLRPGRFDRQIYLELPTVSERLAIFEVHTAKLKLSEGIDLEQLSQQTPGFSGADIANIANEAALIAARHNKDAIEMEDFMSAIDRIVAGLEKKSRIITKDERTTIAYHEAGHATASWYLPNADALLKVSIVPRGRSLGAAWYLPQEHVIYTKDQFLDRICATLGGRAAEELFFGQVSSGALDDLEKVTKQAYTMVAYYGLNDALGNVSFYDSTGQYEQSLQKPYSEATAELIDQEVRKLIEEAYERTKKILRTRRRELETLAQRLLDKEVVLKQELIEIYGERPRRADLEMIADIDPPQ